MNNYFKVLRPGINSTFQDLGRFGWYRIEHPTAESCINAQWEFTEVTNPRVIRASCEQLD